MMKRLYNIKPILLFVLLVMASCSETEVITPGESFVRIYDDNRFEASYVPVDIVQADNGNYLVLAKRTTETSDFQTAYLMVLDENGEFILENDFQNSLVHPVDDILEVNGRFFIVGMNNTNLATQLVEVSVDGTVAAPVVLSGTYYPLHAAIDGQQVILQSYNSEDKKTVLSVYNLQGSITKQQSFDIGPGSETEAPIINHFTNSGKKLPFLAGRASNGLYYFNGFYNYTFSLVFTDLGDENPSGVLQGQHADGGLSAVLPLDGESFALASFNYGQNYLMPKTSVSTRGISSATDMVENPYPELLPNADIRIREARNQGNKVIIIGSSTLNGQIVVYGYSRGSGTLIGTRYLGYGNRNTFSSIIQTADGGLAVLGTTSVAGRFDRIILYKLSVTEAKTILDQNVLGKS